MRLQNIFVFFRHLPFGNKHGDSSWTSCVNRVSIAANGERNSILAAAGRGARHRHWLNYRCEPEFLHQYSQNGCHKHHLVGHTHTHTQGFRHRAISHFPGPSRMYLCEKCPDTDTERKHKFRTKVAPENCLRANWNWRQWQPEAANENWKVKWTKAENMISFLATTSKKIIF